VHVRRALLLFAIVLGLAALAASLSRPREERDREQPVVGGTATAPTLEPGAAGSAPETLVFDAQEDEIRRLEENAAATVLVEVDEPGEVSIPGLGLTAAAEPLTPARFDVLAAKPGEYELTFTPAAGDESEAAGTLDVSARDE
jgi:hypothetical protein